MRQDFVIYGILSCCLLPSASENTVEIVRKSRYSWRAPTNDAIEDPFIIHSKLLPLEERFYPTVANGYIGHVLYSRTVFVNGLYNGKQGKSHRAEVPVEIPHLFPFNFNNNFTLDMRKNIFYHDIVLSAFNHVTTATYTHCRYNRLLVFEITIRAETPGSFQFERDAYEPISQDIVFTSSKVVSINSSLCTKKECTYLLKTTAVFGHTKIAEEDFSKPQEVVVVSSTVPDIIRWRSGDTNPRTYVFFSSVGSTYDEAMRFYLNGVKSVQSGLLQSSHVKSWEKSWANTSIDVSGDMSLRQAITSTLYYLLSSFPPLEMPNEFSFNFYGVGPGGLARGAAGRDYMGHVFWDQDFWMVPGLLPLYPELAQKVIQYRIKNLPGALMKAKSLHWKGAAYPWEAAYTGADVCPGEEYITNEIHVTGDVIFLLKQYVHLTSDWKIFSEKLPSFSCDGSTAEMTMGYSCESILISNYTQCFQLSAWDMLRETATFWMSKATWNDKVLKYVINDVMGPDEYHSPVNNSAFTNVIASLNLRFAADVAVRFGICSNLVYDWINVSENLDVPFDDLLEYHPEFDGFNYSIDVVKQADTIMLGFPLALNMSNQVKQNDMIIYDNATTNKGPAMTWGMFAINWLELKNEAKAAPMFLRQMRNIQAPFNIWSEEESGLGAVNFLTGMGGFIQSIIYGYFGLRINEANITIDPHLIPLANGSKVQDMTLDGLHYQGFLLNLHVAQNEITVTYVSSYNPALTQGMCIYILTRRFDSHNALCIPKQHVTVARVKLDMFISKSK